jgi:hypothetical protein
MNSLIHSSRKGTSGAGKKSAFRTVLIYEDRDAALQAIRFCNSLEKNLGVKCQLSDRMWRFDVLGIPEIRNIAASSAAVADLVIFSKSEQTELPAKVREWLDMWAWLIDRGNPALIAIFGTSPPESQPVRTHLRNVTRKNGIDYFERTIPQEARGSRSLPVRRKTARFRTPVHHQSFS